MIARTLRTAAEWLRNRRAERVRCDVARAARAEREARQLEWLRQADAHRIEARRLFREAAVPEEFAERCRLYNLALATECRGEACHAMAGGDTESAVQHTMEAEDCERRAGMPQPVANTSSRGVEPVL